MDPGFEVNWTSTGGNGTALIRGIFSTFEEERERDTNET
jgi:hypothetical protein